MIALLILFSPVLAEDTFRFMSTPLARIVIDDGPFDWRRFIEIDRGEITVTYNANVRRPAPVSEPTPVDCSAVTRIGVAYFLRRSRSSRLFTENVTQDVTWQHQASEDLLEKYSVVQTWWQKRGQRLSRFWQTLDDDWRKDGVITFEVRLRGRLIVAEAFEFRGCA